MRNLVQYRPGRLSIFNGLDNVFDSFFAEPVWRNRVPAVDIREEDDCYIVQAELPGVAEKELKVSVNDNVLTIAVKSDKDAEGEGEDYIVKERRHSAFTRTFVLPRDAEHEGVAAEFKQGLLTLHVPKATTGKPRQIPINAA